MNESSGKLSPLGWAAKKMDENIFLVSFTATDGITPKGFYFDINAETGEIRNIAAHPDLQLKYRIAIK
jgi:predicted RNA-binding protein associated with RNAse of E/G family